MTNYERLMKILKSNAKENEKRKEKLKYEKLNVLNFGEYSDYIKKYLSVFASSFPSCNYTFLINNMNSLDIYIYHNDKSSYNGNYKEDTNDIIMILPVDSYKIDNNVLDTLNHELLHMSSHNCSKDLDTTGFRQKISPVHKSTIGHGLNEGYTEYLNLKYFSNTGNSPYYKEERLLAQKVEKLVGKPLMEEAYFDGNLYIIIKSLSNYSNLKESVDIIREMDKLSMMTSNSQEKTAKYYDIDRRLNVLVRRKENLQSNKKIKRY